MKQSLESTGLIAIVLGATFAVHSSGKVTVSSRCSHLMSMKIPGTRLAFMQEENV